MCGDWAMLEYLDGESRKSADGMSCTHDRVNALGQPPLFLRFLAPCSSNDKRRPGLPSSSHVNCFVLLWGQSSAVMSSCTSMTYGALTNIVADTIPWFWLRLCRQVINREAHIDTALKPGLWLGFHEPILPVAVTRSCNILG